MIGIWTDLRHGARKLARTPVFTITAILIVSLGVAASAAAFSLVHKLRSPAHVTDPEYLVFVHGQEPPVYEPVPLAYPAYTDIRANNEVFSGLAAYGLLNVSLQGSGEARVVRGMITSDNFFDVLGASPRAGRFYGPGEDRVPGGAHVAVLSHRAWREQFGGDPGVVGRRVLINGSSFEVIAIAPRRFAGPLSGGDAAVWVPMGTAAVTAPLEDLSNRYGIWLDVFGRLKPGFSHEQARANLAALAQQMEAAYPEEHENWRLQARAFTPLPVEQEGAAVGFLRILSVVAFLVLLITGGNVGGMLLARAASRRPEAAVHMCLGAERGRVARRFLVEVLALFAVGALGGVLLVYGLGELIRIHPPHIDVPLSLEISVGPAVVVFAVCVAAVAGLAFGLFPALTLPRLDLASLVREDSARTSKRSTTRSLFIAGQVAASLVLLAVAGLFLRALQDAGRADPGFVVDGLHMVSYNLSLANTDRSDGTRFYRDVLNEVRRQPGITGATLAQTIPLGRRQNRQGISAEGVELPDGRSTMPVGANVVDSGFFETMGIPIVAGEPFSDAHREDGLPVAIINQTLARRFWPDGDPVGSRLYLGEVGSGRAVTIIGIARDGKYEFLDEAPRPALYLPFSQNYRAAMAIVYRAGDRSAALAPVVQRIAAARDPSAPFVESVPVAKYIGAQLARQRIAATVAGSLGIVGLLLSAVGIYSLVSFGVMQRKQELGIRMALGANARDLVWLVTRQGIGPAILGLALGMVLVVWLSRLLTSLLLGVSPTDVPSLVGAAVLLSAVTVLASYLPARRATGIDPILALRGD